MGMLGGQGSLPDGDFGGSGLAFTVKTNVFCTIWNSSPDSPDSPDPPDSAESPDQVSAIAGRTPNTRAGWQGQLKFEQTPSNIFWLKSGWKAGGLRPHLPACWEPPTPPKRRSAPFVAAVGLLFLERATCLGLPGADLFSES